MFEYSCGTTCNHILKSIPIVSKCIFLTSVDCKVIQAVAALLHSQSQTYDGWHSAGQVRGETKYLLLVACSMWSWTCWGLFCLELCNLFGSPNYYSNSKENGTVPTHWFVRTLYIHLPFGIGKPSNSIFKSLPISTKEGTCQMEKDPHKYWYDTGVSLTVLD